MGRLERPGVSSRSWGGAQSVDADGPSGEIRDELCNERYSSSNVGDRSEGRRVGWTRRRRAVRYVPHIFSCIARYTLVVVGVPHPHPTIPSVLFLRPPWRPDLAQPSLRRGRIWAEAIATWPAMGVQIIWDVGGVVPSGAVPKRERVVKTYSKNL